MPSRRSSEEPPKQRAQAGRAAKKRDRAAPQREGRASPAPTASAESESPRRGIASTLAPVGARPSRSERASAEARLEEIDRVCSAWADIVAERVTADKTFADLVEQAHVSHRDLRGLFLVDALQAAESHVAMIHEVLAKHIVNRKADPVAILEELRARKLRVAAVYAVNAFMGVLNQMKHEKPKWLALDDLGPRLAVLALAHQTLQHALEAMALEAPPDLTEQILQATQDDSVWVWRRMPEPGTDTLAACAAAAAFFRLLSATVLTTTESIAGLYADHASERGGAGVASPL